MSQLSNNLLAILMEYVCGFIRNRFRSYFEDNLSQSGMIYSLADSPYYPYGSLSCYTFEGQSLIAVSGI